MSSAVASAALHLLYASFFGALRNLCLLACFVLSCSHVDGSTQGTHIRRAVVLLRKDVQIILDEFTTEFARFFLTVLVVKHVDLASEPVVGTHVRCNLIELQLRETVGTASNFGRTQLFPVAVFGKALICDTRMLYAAYPIRPERLFAAIALIVYLLRPVHVSLTRCVAETGAWNRLNVAKR